MLQGFLEQGVEGGLLGRIQGFQQPFGALDLLVLLAQLVLEALAVAGVELFFAQRVGDGARAFGQDFADGEQEVGGVDGLFQEAHRPQAEGEFFVFLGDVGGREEQHRDVAGFGVLTQVVDQGKAVHFGHQDVGDDHGRRFLGDQLQGVLAVAGRGHRVAFEAQGDFEQAADLRHVFDDKDGALGNGHASIVA